MSITLKKLTITNAQAEEILQGIGMIDAGYQTTVDGKSTTRGFRLDASTRTRLVRIGIILKPIAEAYAKNRDKNFEDHNPVVSTNKDGDEVRHIPSSEIAAFNKAKLALAEVNQAIELPTIKMSAFSLGSEKNENPIPSLAITMISPILDESPDQPQPEPQA